MRETETTLPSEPGLGARTPWYAGITRYQWLVLAIASAGWVFDIYEGQIFVTTRTDLLSEILQRPLNDPAIANWGERLNSVSLIGGAMGGVIFGMLADRLGRSLSMILTILMYTLFSGLTYFAHTLSQVALLRFLVALGTGGEWAVAAALVAEVFPTRARAQASSIFHASSVIGTWMAALAGLWVGAQWRYAYLIGVLPALLTLMVRVSIREPEKWKRAHTEEEAGSLERRELPAEHVRCGSLASLFAEPIYRRRAILGLLLAAVGLAGFWGVMVGSQDLVMVRLKLLGLSHADAARKAKIAYGIVATAGAGVGLVAMGPICATIGRRRAFALFFTAALIITPITCFLPRSYGQMLLLLPLFGFCNVGLHAGYAIYFPELFPTRLRATGSGWCFNGGRLVAASMLFFSGWLKATMGSSHLPLAITLLSFVYLIGFIVLMFLPETKGQPLEE